MFFPLPIGICGFKGSTIIVPFAKIVKDFRTAKKRGRLFAYLPIFVLLYIGSDTITVIRHLSLPNPCCQSCRILAPVPYIDNPNGCLGNMIDEIVVLVD
jgi:hypothetical protein